MDKSNFDKIKQIIGLKNKNAKVMCFFSKKIPKKFFFIEKSLIFAPLKKKFRYVRKHKHQFHFLVVAHIVS